MMTCYDCEKERESHEFSYSQKLEKPATTSVVNHVLRKGNDNAFAVAKRGT